jgi:hypothetical protein
LKNPPRFYLFFVGFKERATGKSTFIKWLKSIFGLNMTYIKGDSFSSQFNSDWTSMLIVAIDEVFLIKRNHRTIKIFLQQTKIKWKPKEKTVRKLNFLANLFFVPTMKTILFRLMKKKFDSGLSKLNL